MGILFNAQGMSPAIRMTCRPELPALAITASNWPYISATSEPPVGLDQLPRRQCHIHAFPYQRFMTAEDPEARLRESRCIFRTYS